MMRRGKGEDEGIDINSNKILGLMNIHTGEVDIYLSKYFKMIIKKFNVCILLI